MDSRTRQLVRHRANHCCEYCGRTQESSTFPLQIEHVIPKKHGGADADTNLALACMDCNLAKGPNLAGRESGSEQLVPLFNPRTQDWNEHFERRGVLILGRTAVGRVTANVLNFNSEERLAQRVQQQHEDRA